MSAPINKNQDKNKRGERQYRRRPLTNYYRSDAVSTRSPFSSKPAAGRGRAVLFNILDILLLLIVLAALVYSLMLKPNPVIKTTGNDYHTDKQYAATIAPLLGGIKNGNKLSFDETSVVGQIKQKLPEVQAAKIELPFFSPRPVVWLNVSKPAFYLKSEGSKYLVDSQGTAVAAAAATPDIKNLTTVSDQTGFKVLKGAQVLSSQNVAVINTVISQSKAAKVPLASLTLPPKAEELDLRTTDQSYYVKFNLAGDGLVQAGQFLAARHQFAKNGQKPSQYLDVRVPGKIFYY